MRVLPLCAVAFLVTLAGCAMPAPANDGPSPGDEPASASAAPAGPCVTPAEKASVFEGAEGFAAGMADLAFHMRMEGRQGGERVDGLMSVTPAEDMVRVRYVLDGDRYEYRVSGDLFWMDTPEGTGWGRNYQEGAMFAQVHASILEVFSTDQPEFADEHGVDDYAVSCGDIDGARVLTFTLNESGREEIAVIERDAPYRPVSLSVVDETLDDRYRMSLSYEVPEVTIDQTDARLGAYVHFDVLEYSMNDRGGLYMVGRLNELTHWVPISDIMLRLMEDEMLVPGAQAPLRAGLQQLGEGDRFRFTDTDQNGMLSDGDVFVMDFTPDHDFTLYDRWAAAPARLGARNADAPAEPAIVAPEGGNNGSASPPIA